MMIRHRIAAVTVALATAGGLAGAGAVSAQAAVPQARAAGAMQAAAAHGMHLGAGLRGNGAYQVIRGHASYESYRYRHMDLSLWNARRLAGRTLVVYVHGTRVGSMRIWGGGLGRFTARRGVPRCSAGTAIAIRTRTGALVASGTFHRSPMMR